jgi:two-component system chemotaxis response regulator CheY
MITPRGCSISGAGAAGEFSAMVKRMPAPDLKILVVDDHSVIRKVVVRILAKLGYARIREAGDGAAALALLEAEQADLIISDLNMPRISGLELLAMVRQHPGWAALPFIILTSELRSESFHQAFETQATQYIIKPFTAEEFTQKISQLFPA